MWQEDPTYEPPFPLGNGHLATVLPALSRRVEGPDYLRRSLETPDGDFLDLDLALGGNDRAVVLCHGLEGSAARPYMRGMARHLRARGWDVVAMNYRGCGGRPNRLPGSYHSGATGDLDLVVRHVAAKGYGRVALAGFSLGGNLALQYAGERGAGGLPPQLRAVAAVSAPCDLAESSARMELPANRLYKANFFRDFARKVELKAQMFPHAHDWQRFGRLRTFREFDHHFTAPLHGFESADDYYRRCSCLGRLDGITLPSLLLSAQDDPFLGPNCFPWDAAGRNPKLRILAPKHGGHVGFATRGKGGVFFSEKIVADFFDTFA